MKKLSLAVAMMFGTLVSLPSLAAGTATTTFPVNITLNSACKISTTPGAVSFTYNAFQGSAATATGTSVGVTCTSSLPYSASLATAPGNGYNVTDNATNLAYTLTLNGSAADLTGQTGSGAEQTIAIAGTMAAGQAGTCGSGSCTNATSTNLTQTLTISY
jgi:spore coat protein U-like protein